MHMIKHSLRIIAAASALVPSIAFASSHREAPAIANDPAADNTDLYAWVTPGTHDKVNIVANWIPLEEPSGGPNFHSFSDDVLYEVHVTRGNSLEDVVRYQIQFTTTTTTTAVDPNAPIGGGKEFFSQISGRAQTYSVKKVVGTTTTTLVTGAPVTPPNIGPRTDAVAANGGYNQTYTDTFIRDLTGGGRVWAGPRDDGFYVDLGAVFDLANLRAAGSGRDAVAGYNTHSIALEIPTTELAAGGTIPTSPSVDSVIGVWASSSRRKVTTLKNNGQRDSQGPWVQVSRLGLPLINEAVIGIQDKDKFNATQPAGDVTNFGAYFLNPVIVNDAVAVGIYDSNAATTHRANRTDILDIISLNDANHTFTAIGDVLRVDLSANSGFPNGRPIPGAGANQEGADVTDVLLSVLLLSAPGAIVTSGVSDAVGYNDKNFLTQFPWLPLPWQGFSEGHYKATP